MVDEIEMLDLLIEKWDEEHNTFDELDPVELLKGLMEENQLKSKDMVEIFGIPKSSIRKLSAHFKMYQEAFNRPYPLVNKVPHEIRTAS